jgi:hypothetical protein
MGKTWRPKREKVAPPREGKTQENEPKFRLRPQRQNTPREGDMAWSIALKSCLTLCAELRGGRKARQKSASSGCSSEPRFRPALCGSRTEEVDTASAPEEGPHEENAFTDHVHPTGLFERLLVTDVVRAKRLMAGTAAFFLVLFIIPGRLGMRWNGSPAVAIHMVTRGQVCTNGAYP